jgi:branched-chain amino acid transport system permease protein
MRFLSVALFMLLSYRHWPDVELADDRLNSYGLYLIPPASAEQGRAERKAGWEGVVVDSTILLFLLQDGVTNGAVYALLGFALVLVFTVTRVIFIPQGEFVAFGGLTYAALRAGKTPATVQLLMILAIVALMAGLWARRRTWSTSAALRDVALTFSVPALVWLATRALGNAPRPAAVDVLLTVAIVAPMGPYLYRFAFEPLAEASVLTLFIAAVAVHLGMTAMGLAFFGAEGLRAPALIDGGVSVGPLLVTGQSIAVYITVLVLIVALWLLFGYTLAGKALRATAINRAGAHLVGISTALAGRTAYALAATMGAISGILIVPTTTLYYDSGFLVGMKGFVAAIVGGLASYPLTGLAALGIGTAEAFAAFQASQYKEVIVFALVMPVLVLRSLGAAQSHDDEE